MWGHPHFIYFFLLRFGHISFGLRFEQDPISGYRDIPLSIFWGCLPFKVIFHAGSLSFYITFWHWFGHISLSLRFDHDRISGCLHIPLSIFWVVFHLRSSSMHGHLHFMSFSILVWSHKLKFKFWGRSDQWLLRNSTINILRLSYM